MEQIWIRIPVYNVGDLDNHVASTLWVSSFINVGDEKSFPKRKLNEYTEHQDGVLAIGRGRSVFILMSKAT